MNALLPRVALMTEPTPPGGMATQRIAFTTPEGRIEPRDVAMPLYPAKARAAGAELRRARERAHLSVLRAARMLGVIPVVLEGLESGERRFLLDGRTEALRLYAAAAVRS